MSSTKSILSGVFWNVLGNVINALYNFFSVPILLIHFGKEQYGLIGLALSVNVYLKLMDMGFSSGNVKFFSTWLAQKNYVNLNKLFQSSLVFYGTIGILNALVLFVVSIFASHIFLLSPAEVVVLRNMFYVLMISSIFGWISSLLDQFLRANEIIGWEQRLILFSKLLQVLMLYLTVKYSYSVINFFALTTFSSLIILPFSVWKIKTLKYKTSFLPVYHHQVFKQVLPYCLSVFSFSIFQFSAVYLRPLILSMRSGIISVSDYRIMEGFASLILLLGSNFMSIILPSASKARATGDKAKEERIAYDGTKFISIFLCCIAFGFVLVSKDVLNAYVGNKYDYLTVWLNIWILTLLGTHNSALSSLVLSDNNLRPIVVISAISTIISLTVAWFLSPVFMVGGVIIGYLSYVIIQISFYYIYYYPKVLKLDSKRIFFKSFLTPATYIGLLCLVVYFLGKDFYFHSKYLRIIVLGGIYGVLLIPLIYLVIFTKQDRVFLKQLLLKK